MRRLMPPTLLYACAAIMILLRWLWPIRVLVAFPYNILGVLPLLLGTIVAMWGSWKFRRVGTNIKTFEEPDRLVTDGLYRCSRNPMYLGFALMLLGLGVILGAASPAPVLVVFVVITDRWYIAFEEKRLAARFGQEYEAYRSRTRRWT